MENFETNEISEIQALIQKRQKIADRIFEIKKELAELKEEYKKYKHLDCPKTKSGFRLPTPKKHYF